MSRQAHHLPEQAPPDQGPDQACDDVADKAVTGPGHYLARPPARDQAHDQPGDDSTWNKDDVCKHTQDKLQSVALLVWKHGSVERQLGSLFQRVIGTAICFPPVVPAPGFHRCVAGEQQHPDHGPVVKARTTAPLASSISAVASQHERRHEDLASA
jgi:hypothetical protein